MTNKCFTTSPGNTFILGSEGQRFKSRVTKTVPSWVFALLWVLASSSFYVQMLLVRSLLLLWLHCRRCVDFHVFFYLFFLCMFCIFVDSFKKKCFLHFVVQHEVHNINAYCINKHKRCVTFIKLQKDVLSKKMPAWPGLPWLPRGTAPPPCSSSTSLPTRVPGYRPAQPNCWDDAHFGACLIRLSCSSYVIVVMGQWSGGMVPPSYIGVGMWRIPNPTESDTFFPNPKSVGYLKSDRDRFEIFVLIQLYNYFRLMKRSVVVFTLLFREQLQWC